MAFHIVFGPVDARMMHRDVKSSAVMAEFDALVRQGESNVQITTLTGEVLDPDVLRAMLNTMPHLRQ
jgi:hypothetical protein